jgi:hypothetical protein
MDRVGISLGDLLSNLIFENVVDEDLSSMYPSIILAGNIDVSTMIGKIVDNIDPEFGAKFYAFLVEDNFSVFLNKTLNLPTSEEVLENLEDLIS